jgi:hypothetical protein
MKGVYFFALAAVVACASSNTQRASVPKGTDRNIITEEEIRSVPAANLYDLVSKLRPNMLRSRGQSSLGGSAVSDYPVVYVDGRSYGDIGSLRSLIPNQVSLIRYYEASDAAARFGMINASGVIDVTTRQ